MLYLRPRFSISLLLLPWMYRSFLFSQHKLYGLVLSRMKELKFVKQLLITVNDLSLPLFLNKKHVVVCKKCKVHKTSKWAHTRNLRGRIHMRKRFSLIYLRECLHAKFHLGMKLVPRRNHPCLWWNMSLTVYTFLPRWNFIPGWTHPRQKDMDEISSRDEKKKKDV